MSEFFFGKLSKQAGSVAVIMAGGSGTRFWPASRRALPKQFLALAGGRQTLIQAAAARLLPLVGEQATLVVTGRDYIPLVREQLPEAAALAEPVARNTAPCVAYAALSVLESAGDVPMIVVPADHFIRGEDELRGALLEAVEIAAGQDLLVTIGIAPTAPETGYGYIQAGGPRSGCATALEVKRFVEKPDRATAERYLAAGDYFWNSGMFVWRPSTILAAIEQHLPSLGGALGELKRCMLAGDSAKLSTVFSALEAVSIDFGVMEKARNVAMIPGASFEWSDIGSWDAWARLMRSGSKDAGGNVLQGDVLAIDCNNLVAVAKERLIAAVGLKDIIVVETGDAILVCPASRAQDVKTVVDELKKANRQKLL